MKSLPGVTCVSVKPVNDGKKPNDHGVRWKLNGKGERSACTNKDGAKPTLLHAIQAALAKLSTAIGEEVVAQAVAVAGSVVASGPSADEMCWLANWCEEHAEPESITMEMANAALRHRRLPHQNRSLL